MSKNQVQKRPETAVEADLHEAGNLHIMLTAQLRPEHNPIGRRIKPGSMPPISLDVADLISELERFLPDWTKRARWLLDPWSRYDLTARTGHGCPYCGGPLVAWLHPKTKTSYIICTLDQPHEEGEPKRWFGDDWRRLGVLMGVYDAQGTPQERAAWSRLAKAVGT